MFHIWGGVWNIFLNKIDCFKNKNKKPFLGWLKSTEECINCPRKHKNKLLEILQPPGYKFKVAFTPESEGLPVIHEQL